MDYRITHWLLFRNDGASKFSNTKRQSGKNIKIVYCQNEEHTLHVLFILFDMLEGKCYLNHWADIINLITQKTYLLFVLKTKLSPERYFLRVNQGLYTNSTYLYIQLSCIETTNTMYWSPQTNSLTKTRFALRFYLKQRKVTRKNSQKRKQNNSGN